MPAQLNNTHDHVRVCTVLVTHGNVGSAPCLKSWCAASKRHKYVWCPSLTMKHSGSHSYLLKVWGDVVHKTRQQARQQATTWRVSQAIAREKDQAT